MKVDFYTHVHKQQRQQLFLLAIKAGETNYHNPAEVSSLATAVTQLTTELTQHVGHEETFIHPLLSRKLPRIAHQLDHEHDSLEQEIAGLETNFKHIQLLSDIHPKRQEQGLAFYRTLNQFIAKYLNHIHQEEEILRVLWEVAADSELIGMMSAFLIYANVENGTQWIGNQVQQLNQDEQLLLVNTVQLLAPAPLFLSLCSLMQEVLGTTHWNVIKNQLENPC